MSTYTNKFVKSLKFDRVCRYCQSNFKSGDAKTYTCNECKKPKPCKCGCGKLVKTSGRFYYRSHSKIGKTYKEIYGTDTPSCGFKSGAQNPNYDPILKEKSTNSLLDYYKNNPEKVIEKLLKGIKTRQLIEPIGSEEFRSQWEKDVFLILKKNNIPFEREVGIPLVKGLKIVDFVVDSSIYIEVSGLSYIRDPEKFKTKIAYLQLATDKPVIILTDKTLLDKIKKDCWYTNVFTCLMTEESILKKIEFCRLINNLNKSFELTNKS